MKKILSIITITAIIIASIVGCQNPMITDFPGSVSPDVAPNGEEITTGVTFIIPRYSPLLESFFEQKSHSRAFLIAHKVEVTIYDSIEHTNIIKTETFNDPSTSGGGHYSCSLVLPPGQGYSAKVDIYNIAVSDSEPVVSGYSEAFDITEGAVIQAPVTCIPVNPISLAANTQYDTTIKTFFEAPTELAFAGELWFEMLVPASGYFEYTIDLAEGLRAQQFIYNSEGVFISNNRGPYWGEATPGETLYIGILVKKNPPSSEVPITVSWREVSLQLLSDADVPDPIFRAVLADMTGKEFSVAGSTPPNQITDYDLVSLEDLSLLGVADLTGIEYCAGLRNLYISNSPHMTAAQYQKISAENIPYLEVLNISGFSTNGDDEVDPVSAEDWTTIVNMLGSHHDLQMLSLSYFDITDTMLQEFVNEANQNITHLYDLSLNYNQRMTDIAILSDLASIDGLELNYCGLTDISALSSFTSLTCLSLCGNSPTDISVLSNLTSLRDLDLSDNGLTDLSGLSNLTSLMSLDLTNCGLTDISVLSNLTSLRDLDLSDNGLTDLSGISNLTSLQYLDLSGNNLTDLSPIEELYDAGGFHSDRYNGLDITNCGLELYPGTENRRILDKLLAAEPEIQILYEQGNRFFDISYEPIVYNMVVGDTVSIEPSVVGEGISSYSIAPALPAGSGLVFDPSTGEISGTAAQALMPTRYTVTAYDYYGGIGDSAGVAIIINASTGVTVSGTITLPESVENKLFAVNIDTDGDGGNGVITATAGYIDGTSAEYSIENVPAGEYYIYSVVYDQTDDIANASAPVAGDYFGVYSDPGSPTITVGSENISGIDITLEERQ